MEDGKLNLLSGALQNYYDESSEADRTNRLIKELYKWSFNNKKPIDINGYSKMYLVFVHLLEVGTY